MLSYSYKRFLSYGIGFDGNSAIWISYGIVFHQVSGVFWRSCLKAWTRLTSEYRGISEGRIKAMLVDCYNVSWWLFAPFESRSLRGGSRSGDVGMSQFSHRCQGWGFSCRSILALLCQRIFDLGPSRGVEQRCVAISHTIRAFAHDSCPSMPRRSPPTGRSR